MMAIEHGGNLQKAIEKYGGSSNDWIDISTGISPFSAQLPELSLSDWHRLPESRTISKIAKIAEDYYRAKQKCLMTSGSQAVINQLPVLLKGKVGILEPTYGEYAAAFKRHRREYAALTSYNDIASLRSVILANPNNPDGRLYSQAELLSLARKLSNQGGYLVVDEAFCDVCDVCDGASMLGCGEVDNLIILRSFGKFFGLAGARIGFVFANDHILDRLAQLQGPWAVAGPSLAVAEFVLSQTGIGNTLIHKINDRYKDMLFMLKETRLQIVGGTKLFTLIEHECASDLHEYLLSQKILSRKFDYNKHWIRFGLTSNSEEDQRLENAILSFEGR